MAHVDFRFEQHDHLWVLCQAFVEASDSVGLKATIDAAAVLSFVPRRGWPLKFMMVNFQFGCFHQFKVHYKFEFNDYNNDTICWLFGIFHTDFINNSLLLKCKDWIIPFAADWLDLGHVGVFDILCKYKPALANRGDTGKFVLNYLLSVLSRHMFVGREPTSFYLFLFQNKDYTPRPSWSRRYHYRTDWIFKEQVMTVLCMIKFHLPIHKDVTYIIFKHAFANHLDWLATKLKTIEQHATEVTNFHLDDNFKNWDQLTRECAEMGLLLPARKRQNVTAIINVVKDAGIRRAGLKKGYHWFRGGKTFDQWLARDFYRSMVGIALVQQLALYRLIPANHHFQDPAELMETVYRVLARDRAEHLFVDVFNGSMKVDKLLNLLTKR